MIVEISTTTNYREYLAIPLIVNDRITE